MMVKLGNKIFHFAIEIALWFAEVLRSPWIGNNF